MFLYTVAFRSIRAIPICLSYVRGMPLLRNIQTTYLTGLSIEMTPIQGTGDILVNIRWDDYNITNDTRWTGKIALKDTAVLTAGSTITLAQNRTVAQPTRDPETGLFAGRTRWTCENGSYFRQDSASALILTENSSVTFENGSRYELSKGARVEIHAGCSLIVRPGAKIQLKGIVEVDSGGVLTLYDTAKMGNLSRLIVRPGGKLVVDGGTLTSAGPNELWLSYPTRTRSITDNVSHFTNCEFIVSKYCRDSSVDPNTCTCPELMSDTVLDLNELEQWHTAAQSANLANYANIGDPYSLTETRFMEGYAETFAGDAEDAEMANYAEFHALKLALRDTVAANDVPVGANDHSPLQKTTASLDMKSVPAGVYVLRVTGTDGHEYYQKIVRK